jgi:hypothetical protein
MAKRYRLGLILALLPLLAGALTLVALAVLASPDTEAAGHATLTTPDAPWMPLNSRQE